jgi:uncharacterized lipoprotein YmbA
MNKKNVLSCLAGAWVSLLCSCVVPESTYVAPDFFLLSPVSLDANYTHGNENKSFYLSQVEIPEYLRDLRMVSRPDMHSVVFREGKRWGEPLTDGIARVVALNMSRELNTSFFSVFPNRKERELAWDVSLSVTSFGRSNSDSVELVALWEIDGEDPNGTQRGTFSINLMIDDNKTDDIKSELRGLNDCLQSLALRLSGVISECSDSPPKRN